MYPTLLSKLTYAINHLILLTSLLFVTSSTATCPGLICLPEWRRPCPATHLWRDLFTMFELTTNMRQRNDTTYSEILNHIRTGCHTPNDTQLLRSRLTSGIDNPVSLSDEQHRKNYPARRDVRDYRLRRPTETTDFQGLGLEWTSVVAREYH